MFHLTDKLLKESKIFYKIFNNPDEKKVNCALVTSIDVSKEIICEEEKMLSTYGKVYYTKYPIQSNYSLKVQRTLKFENNDFIVFILKNINNSRLIFSLFNEKDAEEMIANILNNFSKEDSEIILKILKDRKK